MLYKVGTVREIASLVRIFPEPVIRKLHYCTSVLDLEYGAERNYLEHGGYSLLAETKEDVCKIRELIDLDNHACEWADIVEGKCGFLSALYLLNDDFSIVVFMPLALAPENIKNELEEQL